MIQHNYILRCGDDWHTPYLKREETPAEKKRNHFGAMFTLHQLLNRAGVQHENKDTLICSGYMKTKERF